MSWDQTRISTLLERLRAVAGPSVSERAFQRGAVALGRADHGELSQELIESSKQDLLSQSASPSSFQNRYDRLSGYPRERDHLVVLLSQISQNPQLQAILCESPPESQENRVARANSGGHATKTGIPGSSIPREIAVKADKPEQDVIDSPFQRQVGSERMGAVGAAARDNTATARNEAPPAVGRVRSEAGQRAQNSRESGLSRVVARSASERPRGSRPPGDQEPLSRPSLERTSTDVLLDSALSLDAAGLGCNDASGMISAAASGAFEASPELQQNDLFGTALSTATTQAIAGALDYHANHMDAAASVQLPDAGRLFTPLREVIASAAPRHMIQISQTAGVAAHHLDEPYYTGDVRLNVAAQMAGNPKFSLKGLSSSVQDRLLVHDLLSVFQRLDPEYLELETTKGPAGNPHLVYIFPYHNSRHCSSELTSKVRMLLPLAESAIMIARYSETRLHMEFGPVCNAFAQGLADLLDDWDMFLASLEHKARQPTFGVETLQFYCQTASTLLELAAGLCAEASAKKLWGARLLDLLHAKSKTLAGDMRWSRIVQRLLHAASVPYFKTLTTWVSTGVIDDRYQEFMVQEVEGMGVDMEVDGEIAFWSERYVLRSRAGADGSSSPDVPSFLTEAAQMVLNAGKNWAILRYCKSQASSQDSDPGAAPPMSAVAVAGEEGMIDYDAKGQFLQAIEQHHRESSAALLHIMRSQSQLNALLNSIKSFFLLSQCDFMANFLDLSEDELKKRAVQVSENRLRSLLELAIRTSSLARDLHHEGLTLSLNSSAFVDLHTAAFNRRKKNTVTDAKQKSAELRAVELVMLSMKVEWPLSIVLSPHLLCGYQFCFRHLFNCKSVERTLGDKWQQLSRVRCLRSRLPEQRAAETVLRRVLVLLQRMNFFVQRYMHFITVEVIDPLWHTMTENIAKAKSIDEVIEAHKTCMNRILRYALLAKLPVLSKIALIWWSCRECCWKIDAALRRQFGSAAGRRLMSAEDMVQLANDQAFRKDLLEVENSLNSGLEKLQRELQQHKASVLAGSSKEDGHMYDDLHEEAEMVQIFLDHVTVKTGVSLQNIIRDARAVG